MLTALIWGVAFVLMMGFLGGSAVLCVRMVEQGKNMRALETEKTARQGMDNAWQLEQTKLTLPQLETGNSRKPIEVSFRLDGIEDD